MQLQNNKNTKGNTTKTALTQLQSNIQVKSEKLINRVPVTNSL